MAMYEVRCCCKPAKVLGSIELPDGLRDGQYTPVRMRTPGNQSPPSPDGFAISMELILMRKFTDGCFSGIAVYSEDRPIEFWRTVVGFRERIGAGGQDRTDDLPRMKGPLSR